MNSAIIQDVINQIDDDLIVEADKDVNTTKTHLMRWVAIAIAISIFVSASIVTIVAVKDTIREQQTNNVEINGINKINFYIAQIYEDHEKITDTDELVSVLNTLAEFEGDIVYTCTIMLENNLYNSDEYKELENKKDTFNSPWDYQQLLQNLKRKIDAKTIEKYMPIISEYPIHNLKGLQSPAVIVGTIHKDDLTIDLIKDLVELDFIGSIFISIPGISTGSSVNNIIDYIRLLISQLFENGFKSN